MNIEYSHPNPGSTLLLSLARMLERGSYYGIRALVVFYMIDSSLDIEPEKALSVYGSFTLVVLFGGVIGALLGDLLLGNKKAMLMGGLLHILGCLALCIENQTGLYVGFLFIIAGGGLISPNLLSCFGKIYQYRHKLLDSAFSFLYLTVNLGVSLGVMIVGFYGNSHYKFGFLLAAAFMALSLILMIFFTKREELDHDQEFKDPEISPKVFRVLLVILFAGLFWLFYEWGSTFMIELQNNAFKENSSSLTSNFWSLSMSTMTVIVSVFAFIFWSFIYYSRWVKLASGFLVMAIAFYLLYQLPTTPGDGEKNILLFSFFLLAVAELHIAPVVLSMITRYSHPKFLALMFALSFIPAKLLTSLGTFSMVLPRVYAWRSVIFSIAIGTILLILALLFNKFNKRTKIHEDQS